MRLTIGKKAPFLAFKPAFFAGFITATAVLLALLAASAFAGSDSGQAAFERADYATAFKEWGARAGRGDPAAQYGLGRLYLEGLGVRQSERKAVTWIGKAAAKGHAPAQALMGVLYGSGRGVVQDYAKAAEWLKRAADAGSAEAQSHLGYLYQTGRGVEQSDAEAFRLYELSARQGNPEGQLNLGYMFATGRGTPQDFVAAHMWFNLAAANGSKVAAQNRNEVARKMSAVQIEEAQKRAHAWKPAAAGKDATKALAAVPEAGDGKRADAKRTDAKSGAVATPSPPTVRAVTGPAAPDKPVTPKAGPMAAPGDARPMKPASGPAESAGPPVKLTN